MPTAREPGTGATASCLLAPQNPLVNGTSSAVFPVLSREFGYARRLAAEVDRVSRRRGFAPGPRRGDAASRSRIERCALLPRYLPPAACTETASRPMEPSTAVLRSSLAPRVSSEHPYAQRRRRCAARAAASAAASADVRGRGSSHPPGSFPGTACPFLNSGISQL